ncbi:hypothetical protein CHH83_06000 [Bacillus sp. 7586-K]|nr:hypothetical protein CHH83_06000 [Bacillus sp. 7586-K]
MKAPIIKEQEDLVHEYIVNEYLLHILEEDLVIINNANLKLKDPYIKLVESVLRTIRIKLRDMKAEMKKQEMKVFGPVRDDIMLQYDYYVRGYHAFSRYWHAALKMHGTKLLDEYFRFLQ